MSTTTDEFQRVIKAQLDKKALSDPLFASKYNTQGKSIQDCCNYIVAQVRASGRCGFADDEVIGMAMHYYDEPDTTRVEPLQCKVVVNEHLELSEDEKDQLKQKARDDYYRQAYAEQAAKNQRAKAKSKQLSKTDTLPTLFDDL